LVHITELGSEYFRFDEARQELRGERTGMRYAIGTRVRIQVSRVDLDGRKIDFRLVHEGEELTARAMKDKSGGGTFDGPSDKRADKHAKRSERPDRSAARSTRGSDRGAAVSPIQSLKAAVKKSAAGGLRKSGKPSKKPRR
jgi:ribonuclease R